MTATSLGLGGNPVTLYGAYVINVSSSLGLQQSPSTCQVTLVEDLNSTPQITFSPPEMGEYTTVIVGSKFRFTGIVTRYEEDIRNISGRVITVNISDPREIMQSIPMILAPGFRNAVDGIEDTGCSLADVYGAYDDYDNTGINLSGWNQAGMTYDRIALTLTGGIVTDVGFEYKVTSIVPKAFGELYRFNLDAISAMVDTGHRINSNLLSIADFIQELANRYAFDWYVTSSRAADDVIDVVVHVIDRRTDNVDLSLDDFLAAHSGYVISAKRGYELRNELACSVLYGAPVEQMRQLNITGAANNPIDLSDEGGSAKYYMTEAEMRIVLGTKDGWQYWVKVNGDFSRYGLSSLNAKPTVTGDSSADVKSQNGIDADALAESDEDFAKKGKIYEKLKGHAEATYGKRFLFQQAVDVDYIEAAWTVDTVSGNNDPNEYFRNSQGKTRAYVQYEYAGASTPPPAGGVLGFGGHFAFGKGANAAQALPLELRAAFNIEEQVTQADKADYIVKNSKLYVSATIEEGNIVRIDNPVIYYIPDTQEIQEEIEAAAGSTTHKRMFNNDIAESKSTRQMRGHMHGTEGAYSEIHAMVYQPTHVFVPVRARFSRYGPVFASNIDENSQGKLDISQDDGFAPWEFGGFTVMLDSMQLKVDNASSKVKTVESAEVTIEGFPRYAIGESIGQNSNINDISINMQGQVTTSYRLSSFLRRFGELSRIELASLSLFARRGGARTLPQNTIEFIEKHRTTISRQFGGRGSSSTSATSGGAGSFD